MEEKELIKLSEGSPIIEIIMAFFQTKYFL